MAPFNLSDLAVKELKISPKELSPAAAKSYTGNFLFAHFLDFWAIFWMTTLSVGFFKTSLKTFLTTEKLQTAWELVDLSSGTMFTWSAFAFTYFFFSYYFNDGQTWGMKLTKTRIHMKGTPERSALRWAAFSLSLFFTLGLSYHKGTAWLAQSGQVTSHDHLWLTLMDQKEMPAPAVMTLIKDEVEEVVREAA